MDIEPIGEQCGECSVCLEMKAADDDYSAMLKAQGYSDADIAAYERHCELQHAYADGFERGRNDEQRNRPAITRRDAPDTFLENLSDEEQTQWWSGYSDGRQEPWKSNR